VRVTVRRTHCDSDHHLLVATPKIRFSKVKQLETSRRLNLDELKGVKAVVKVVNRFEALVVLQEDRSPDELWKKTKDNLLDVAQATTCEI